LKTIFYIQYADPCVYPPLEHSSRVLADKGWKVVFFGLEGPLKFNFLPHPDVKIIQWAACSPGLRQKLHFFAFCFYALWLRAHIKPDWVYLSDPFSTLLGRFILFLGGPKVIYHEHDSPKVEDVIFSGKRSGFLKKAVVACRRFVGKKADICILPNIGRLQFFCTEVQRQRNSFSVLNCPASTETFPIRDKAKDGPLVLYYHGNVSETLLPLTVIQAMGKLKGKVLLKFSGFETGETQGYIQRLLEVSVREGIKESVIYLGKHSRGVLLEKMAGADVGLALMPRNSADLNMRFMAGASNKAFDYLACGMTMLMSDLDDWNQMFVEPGYGRACDPDSIESITNALQWFLENPEKISEMGRRGRRRIEEEWNYEEQFKPVMKALS